MAARQSVNRPIGAELEQLRDQVGEIAKSFAAPHQQHTASGQIGTADARQAIAARVSAGQNNARALVLIDQAKRGSKLEPAWNCIGTTNPL